jgi:hypothetical protein
LSVFRDCSSFQFALLGIVNAILSIVTAARIFLGEPLLPTAIPLPELRLSVTCSDVYRLDMGALAQNITNWLLRWGMSALGARRTSRRRGPMSGNNRCAFFPMSSCGFRRWQIAEAC